MIDLFHELWNVFSIIAGNHSLANYGVRFAIMLFASMFLMLVAVMRTKHLFDKSHIVLYVGILFLIIRVITLILFEWTWQIGLYDDIYLYILSPPLEHFWNALFLYCTAFYTLHHFNYYPGVLKPFLIGIRTTMVLFFVYASVSYKAFLYSQENFYQVEYAKCAADWQNHLLAVILISYLFGVMITKYKKFDFLCMFWVIEFINHFARFVTYYNQAQNVYLTTVFHFLEMIAIPVLTLHFVQNYNERPNRIPKDRKDRVKLTQRAYIN